MVELISPVPEGPPPRSLATRPPLDADTTIGLVDGMLRPSGMWGEGILDAAERELADRFPRVAFERIVRIQRGPHDPMAWAKAMAQKYAALVIAVGD